MPAYQWAVQLFGFSPQAPGVLRGTPAPRAAQAFP